LDDIEADFKDNTDKNQGQHKEINDNDEDNIDNNNNNKEFTCYDLSLLKRMPQSRPPSRHWQKS
jgi:hypothetical protein